ncbi:MAG: alanine racemase domain protein [Gammaproteobacteria bacterium]|nr:alanine racemase domain protein [Gammaproteobacteria bacterium]
MDTIRENLKSVRQQIADYAQRYQRNLSELHLLAVSKAQPASALKEAFAYGQTDFGENYLQEALSKMNELKALPINWHFIGAIQSNKTQEIAENFSWVHSVDRFKIAERLSAQRPAELSPLKIFLQVNLDQESSKSGFDPSDLAEAAKIIAALPRLKLQGLMLLPAPRTTLVQQRNIFSQLNQIQQELIAKGLSLSQTSMGMSSDMEAAIAEGSNWLRIGSAIFGSRKKHE